MHCRYTNTYKSNYISITAACRVKEFFHGFRLKTLQIFTDGALTTWLSVNVDNSRPGSRNRMEDAFPLTKFYYMRLAINTYFWYAKLESTFCKHVQWDGSEDLHHKDLVYSKFQWSFWLLDSDNEASSERNRSVARICKQAWYITSNIGIQYYTL